MGDDALEALGRARVAVFGLGGVGGAAVEALARSGVGALDLIDHDTVSISNINRQVMATECTLGQAKATAAARRVSQINPSCLVRPRQMLYTPQTADAFAFAAYDYVIDALDTVSAKLSVIEEAKRAGTPVISCMGAGNKLDPTLLAVADIADTTVCPLARVIRKELRKRGITGIKAVYSTEPAIRPIQTGDSAKSRLDLPDDGIIHGHPTTPLPASSAFVPAAAGIIAAATVVRDLTADHMRPLEYFTQ